MLVRCPKCETVYRVDANVPVISGKSVRCGACGADFELRSHIIRRSPVPGLAKAASLVEPAVVKARPLPYSATAAPAPRPVSGQESPTPRPDATTLEAAPPTTAPSATLTNLDSAEWRATPPGEPPSDAVDLRWSLGALRRPAAMAADRSGSLASTDPAVEQSSEPQAAASSIELLPQEQPVIDASEQGDASQTATRGGAAETASVATDCAAATDVEPTVAEPGVVEATEGGPETAESARSVATTIVAPSVTPEEPPLQSQVANTSRPSPLKRVLSGNPALSSEATRLPEPPARKAPSSWQRTPDGPSSSNAQSPPSAMVTQPPVAAPKSASSASPPSTPRVSPIPTAQLASARPEPARPQGAAVRPAPSTDERWSIAPPPPVIDDPLASKDVSAVPEVLPAEQAKRFSLTAAARRTSPTGPDSTVVDTRQREGTSSRRGSDLPVGDLPLALTAAGKSSYRPASSTPGWSRPRSLIGRLSANEWLQSLAALLLVAVLAVQLIYAQRLSLADSERGRPLAEAVCAWLGCSLPLPHANGRVRLVRGTVTEHPEETLALQMSALLVNESSERAAYPLLRLRLLNDAQRVSAERRFHPSEYLDEADRALWHKGLAPGQAVSARLAIVAPASGSDQFLIDLHR